MLRVNRLFTILLLLAALVLSACQPIRPQAVSGALRHVQGEIFLPGVPQWGGVSVSMRIDFSEVNPTTHEATGFINWRNFQPQPPSGETYWKVVDSDVRYVFFGVDVANGDPNTVVVITQLKAKEGWGQGEPGEYGYFWFRDGAEDGTDQWGMRYYSFDPWYEFYPADKSPVEAGYFTLAEMQADDPVLPLTVEIGGLTIQ
jgi:hypothetical protein